MLGALVTACAPDDPNENHGGIGSADTVDAGDIDHPGRLLVDLPTGVTLGPGNGTQALFRGNPIQYGTEYVVEAGSGCLQVPQLTNFSTQDCGVTVVEGQLTQYTLAALTAEWTASTLTAPPTSVFTQVATATTPTSTLTEHQDNWPLTRPGGGVLLVTAGSYTFAVNGAQVSAFDAKQGDRRDLFATGQELLINFAADAAKLPDADDPNSLSVLLTGSAFTVNPVVAPGQVTTVAGWATSPNMSATVILGSQRAQVSLTTGVAAVVALRRIDVPPVTVTDPTNNMTTTVDGIYNLVAIPAPMSSGTEQTLHSNQRTGTGFFVLPGTYRVDLSYNIRDLPRTQSFTLDLN
jgi:hypothetical protein